MKRKITLMLPLQILATFDELAKRQLGIGRNSFFALSALLLLVELSPMVESKRRLMLLDDLEKMFVKAIGEARKAA